MPVNIIETASRGLVESCLQAIPTYAQNITFSQEQVPLESLRPVCRYARTYRIEPLMCVLSAYQRAGIDKFLGVVVATECDRRRLLPPPIIEEHAGQHIIIDGLHRLLLARRENLREVSVAVLRGDLPPLPGDPLHWDQIEIIDHHTAREEKFVNFRPEYFRPIAIYLDSR